MKGGVESGQWKDEVELQTARGLQLVKTQHVDLVAEEGKLGESMRSEKEELVQNGE